MECTKVQTRQVRKPKRVRSAFTTEQVSFLEQQYKKFPYIGTEYRKLVASALNIQDRAVKIWFQNRRMREKKELKEDTVGNGDKSQENQLNDVSNLPVNDQLPYSFKVSPITVGVPIEAIHKEEKTDMKPKTKLNTVTNTTREQFKTNVPFHPVFTSNNGPLNLKKRYIPIELCKKNKISRSIETQPRKVSQNLQQMNQCSKNTTKLSDTAQVKTKKALGTNIKPPKLKTTYLPVMRTVYAHPMAAPGPGVIWKPMSVVPIASPGSFHSVHAVQGTCRVQKNCNCNCHVGHMPSVFSPGVNYNNSPYHQYLISTPYHNHNSRV